MTKNKFEFRRELKFSRQPWRERGQAQGAGELAPELAGDMVGEQGNGTGRCDVIGPDKVVQKNIPCARRRDWSTV